MNGWQPAPALQRAVLFVNPRSGEGKAERARLAEHARARGIEVVVLSGGDLAARARDAVAAGADGLGVAGGDGSLAAVATAARDHGLPFVCIPAGTRNHFAADVGVGRRDIVSALDAFGEALERRIDVGEVNGRLFLNNVSVGVYGEAVRRAGYRDARLRTLLETAARGASKTPDVRVADDDGVEHRGPAVVLVSNNPYAVDRPRRPALDGGRLGVLVLDGRPGARPRSWTAESLRIEAAGPVHAGMDGEAVELEPPLALVTRPLALRVRIARGS